jgi:hypothetical protein
VWNAGGEADGLEVDVVTLISVHLVSRAVQEVALQSRSNLMGYMPYGDD